MVYDDDHYYECSDVANIYKFESIAFIIISFLIWVFGTQRGSPIRKINFSATNVALYVASTIFYAAKHDLFCGLLLSSVHPERDDLLLSRFIVYADFLITVVIMVSIRAAEDAISIFSHVVLATFSSMFWLFATISHDDLREFWMINSVIYASLLCVHMMLGNRSYECSDPIYATRLIYTVISYILSFYGATLLGPWFLDKIDLVQQEWFLCVADVLLVGYILLSIVHFGGARKIEEGLLQISPGELSSMTPSEREKFIISQHIQE